MRITLITTSIAAMMLATPGAAQTEQDFGRYYEEDAWFDITEWFDDNNYNPAEEAIGDQNTAGAGGDDDYGYLDGGDDRWFYDYYDYQYSNWEDLDDDDLYEYSSRYYDFDEDGMYEAFASFYDRDGDGEYEDMEYYSFGDPDPASQQGADDQSKGAQMAAQEQQSRQSARVSLQGQVESSKKVQTGGQQHLVVRLSGTNQNQPVVVDLGPADAIQSPPQQGDTISVSGPRVKVGEQNLVLGQQGKVNGQTIQIDRSPRRYQGTITSLTTAQVGGQTHQLAKLQTDQNKQLMVDLGPKDQLKVNLAENQSVQVSGTPVTVQDRRVLLANRLTRNGQATRIARRQGPTSGR